MPKTNPRKLKWNMPADVEARAETIRETIEDPSEDEILEAIKLIYEADEFAGDLVLLGHVVNPEAKDESK